MKVNQSKLDNKEYKRIIIKTMTYYYKNKKKALYWYIRKNDMLEKSSPRQLVESGRGQEVLDFIKLTLEI